jgi:DICT domain-containing protein
MNLRRTIEFVRENQKELALFNLGPPDPIIQKLEAFLQTQNVRITTRDTASGKPADIAVLSNSDTVLAVVELRDLRELVDQSDSQVAVGIADSAYKDILIHLKETTFTSHDTEQMLYASREIEDRARRLGDGTLHAGFQRCSVMRDQRAIYSYLAAQGCRVHGYACPDDVTVDLGTAQVHEENTAEIANHWFVVFDGGGTDAHKSALLAQERANDEFYGFWTYDAEIVDSLCEYLETTYRSPGDTLSSTG